MLAVAMIKDKITRLETLVEALAVRIDEQTEMIRDLKRETHKVKDNLQRRIPTVKGGKHAKS
jgi:hypothetical protein